MKLAPCCSALAARAGTRQVEATLRADRAAAAVERQGVQVWRALLALAKGRQGDTKSQALRLATVLPRALAAVAAGQLHDIARWGRNSAVQTLRASIPRAVLARTLARRAPRVRRRLREQQQQQDAGQPAEWIDPLAPFRAGEWTEADLVALLFPAPPASFVDRVVYSTGWFDRLAAGTRLAPPDQIADVLVRGLTAGLSQQEIARDLRPLVQGVVSSAKRVARTEGMRVASAMQMASHSQLGDLVAGWQIHATLDERTRPEHAARNGTIYWLHPKAGQRGTDEMPHPPQEADGSMAWNCRCYLTPVLREPDEPGVFDPGVFDPATLTPSPAVYADWWGQADTRRRELAVGARRLATVAAQVADPDWEHFIDPVSGSLLSVGELQAETATDRAARVRRNREATERARRAISQVSTTGTASA